MLIKILDKYQIKKNIKTTIFPERNILEKEQIKKYNELIDPVRNFELEKVKYIVENTDPLFLSPELLYTEGNKEIAEYSVGKWEVCENPIIRRRKGWDTCGQIIFVLNNDTDIVCPCCTRIVWK